MNENRRQFIQALGISLCATTVGCGWGEQAEREERPGKGKGKGKGKEKGPGRREPGVETEAPGMSNPEWKPDLHGPAVIDPKAAKRRRTHHRTSTISDDLERVIMEFDGLTRESLVYRPPGASASNPAPLFMAMHGGNGNASLMSDKNRLLEMAKKQGWFAIFPETDVWAITDPMPDIADHRYLSAVLRKVVKEQPVDKSRIWAMGFSNGGKLAYSLASRSSDLISAIVVCASRMGYDRGENGWDPRQFKAKSVSIMHVHGVTDSHINPEGGELPSGSGGPSMSMMGGLQLWADHIGAEKVSSPDPASGCPKRVTTTRWETADGQVIQGVLDPSLGHRWAEYMTPKVVVSFLTSLPPRKG